MSVCPKRSDQRNRFEEAQANVEHSKTRMRDGIDHGAAFLVVLPTDPLIRYIKLPSIGTIPEGHILWHIGAHFSSWYSAIGSGSIVTDSCWRT